MKVKKKPDLSEAVTGPREVLLDPPEDGQEPELDLSEAVTAPGGSA